MDIALVVAMADNGVIGRGGELPWHLPEDLKYFRAVTMGKPIIMGRRTYESIGRPLPGRANIVVTRNSAFHAEGVDVAATPEAAIRVAERRATEAGVAEIMIIGGAEIYRTVLPRANRIYLTEVHEAAEGDTVFPDFDRDEWRETSREDRATESGVEISFVVLERNAA
jgi:dihydrofolate reductase